MSSLSNEVLRALDSICSSNVEQMKRAERELTAWGSSKDPNYIKILFEIVNGESTSPGRLVACIQLRNIVKRSLGELQNLETGAAQDEAVMKVAMDEVVGSCVKLSGQEQLLSYMLEIVKLVAEDYFPQDWPEPLSYLMTNLVVPFYTTASEAIGDPAGISKIDPVVMEKTVAAFLVLKACFSKYDYVGSTPELLSNLAKVLHFCQTPILNCFKLAAVVLVKFPMVDVKVYQWWMSICTSALQCIVSFHHVDLPEYFEDHLQELMEVVSHCFLVSVSESYMDQIPPGKNADSPYASDLLKTACCKLLYCYVSRYTDEFLPYIVNMTVDLVNCLDKLPVEPHTEDVFTHGLDVLKKAAYYRWPEDVYPFNPNTEAGSATLRTVLNGIIPKLMLLKADDLQDIEDDPMQFIQRDIEGQQRVTRRENLRELITTLITRQPTVVGPQLVALCGRCISQGTDPLSQECACFLLSAICTETQTRARGVTKIRGEEDMMRFIDSKVLPTLLSPAVASGAGSLIHATYFKFATLFRNFIPVEYLEAIADIAVQKVVEGTSIVPSYAADYLTHVMALKQKPNGDGYASESYIRINSYIPKLCLTLPVVVDVLANDLEKIEDEFLVKYFWSLAAVCPLPPADYISFLKKVLDMVRSYVLKGRNPRIRHFLFEIVGSLVKQAPTIQGAVGMTANAATPNTSATSSQQSSPSAGKRVGLADLVQFHAYVATILEEMLQSEETGLHPYCYQILAGLIQTLPSIYTMDEFYALDPPQAMTSTTTKLTNLGQDQTAAQDVGSSLSALKQLYFPMLQGLMSQSKWTSDVASANGLSECVCAYIPRIFLYDDAREPMMKSFLDGFNIAFHQRRVSKQLSSKILLHVLASFSPTELGSWTPKIIGILMPQMMDTSSMVAACICILQYPTLVEVVNQNCGLDSLLRSMLKICDRPIALHDKFAIKLACDVIAANHKERDLPRQIYDALQKNITIERKQREEQQLTDQNFDDTSYNVLASVRDISGTKNAIRRILVNKQLVDLASL
ncbi:Cse1 [Gregarina niphandrodes]|uniref:Cse1 n=1 Tax=Gregarina niphandrodes TaxID=110365 RepID=A0A023AZV7_GRENI|nr:Cse1 [Gregarina niphandrodes]EZG43835.1 Cse1 [Gregarina niphandrodes]|eukprot:XP_011132990.1 Cse1 [Gregarina niphandrodes]